MQFAGRRLQTYAESIEDPSSRAARVQTPQASGTLTGRIDATAHTLPNTAVFAAGHRGQANETPGTDGR